MDETEKWEAFKIEPICWHIYTHDFIIILLMHFRIVTTSYETEKWEAFKIEQGRQERENKQVS